MNRRGFIFGAAAIAVATPAALSAHGEVAAEGYILRHYQKAAIYGLMYGMGTDKLVENYNMTPEEAQRAFDHFRFDQIENRIWASQVRKSWDLATT